MKKILSILVILITVNTTAQIRYVTPTGAGDLSGSSWANASNDLQNTLNASASGDQVWIAAGTYKPKRLVDDFGTYNVPSRKATFAVRNNILIYGGFAGTETLLSERNWITNRTILSGDIDNNDFMVDGLSDEIIGNNSIHVVIISDVTGTSTIDGVIITGGYTANGFNVTLSGRIIDSNIGSAIVIYNSLTTINNCSFIGNEGNGSGTIFNSGSNSTITNCSFSNNISGLSGAGIGNSLSSPTINNCTFSNNLAGTLAAGIYNSASSPSITNCTFTSNTANSNGGAIFNTGSPCSPTITDCSFIGNNANFGGAVYNFFTASPILNRCLFKDNTSLHDGGAVYSTGGTMNIKNSQFYNNSAEPTSGVGGAVYISDGTTNSVLINCTIYGNNANSGRAIFYTSATLKVHNSIVWGGVSGSTYDFKNCIVEGLVGGSNGNLDGTTITLSQLFINSAVGNLKLKTGSPAIDAGSNVLYTNAGGNLATDKDLSNNNRLVTVTIDMGSYEFDAALIPLKYGKIDVKTSGRTAILTWQTHNESNTSLFEIEFSNTGQDYKKVGDIKAANISGENTYSFTHATPSGNVLFYRIKQIDIDGQYSYSPVVKAIMSQNIQPTIYPNPAKDVIYLKDISSSEWDQVRIIGVDGKIVYDQLLSNRRQIDISKLTPGLYQLQLIGLTKNSKVIPFMKN